jgi:type IV secretory pathway VirJ component
MLISDAGGWGDNEKAEADKLVEQGAIVIGVDFPVLYRCAAANTTSA